MSTPALPYRETKPLTIPADAFDGSGVALLVVTGASYGGMWVINALPQHGREPGQGEVIGQIETDEAPQQPDRALTSARAWLEAYCEGTPFSLGHFESRNHEYGPGEAPFFCIALAAVCIPMGNTTEED